MKLVWLKAYFGTMHISSRLLWYWLVQTSKNWRGQLKCRAFFRIRCLPILYEQERSMLALLRCIRLIFESNLMNERVLNGLFLTTRWRLHGYCEPYGNEDFNRSPLLLSWYSPPYPQEFISLYKYLAASCHVSICQWSVTWNCPLVFVFSFFFCLLCWSCIISVG